MDVPVVQGDECVLRGTGPSLPRIRDTHVLLARTSSAASLNATERVVTVAGVFIRVNILYNMEVKGGIVEFEVDGLKHKTCKRCHRVRYPRSKHCGVCGECLLRKDHHCPWVHNCVGFHNFKYFCLVCGCNWDVLVFWPLHLQRRRASTLMIRINISISAVLCACLLPFRCGFLLVSTSTSCSTVWMHGLRTLGSVAATTWECTETFGQCSAQIRSGRFDGCSCVLRNSPVALGWISHETESASMHNSETATPIISTATQVFLCYRPCGQTSSSSKTRKNVHVTPCGVVKVRSLSLCCPLSYSDQSRTSVLVGSPWLSGIHKAATASLVLTSFFMTDQVLAHFLERDAFEGDALLHVAADNYICRRSSFRCHHSFLFFSLSVLLPHLRPSIPNSSLASILPPLVPLLQVVPLAASST